MKNYFKFVVAIVGVTVATFGSVVNAHAKKQSQEVKCISYGTCGTDHAGATIEGQV